MSDISYTSFNDFGNFIDEFTTDFNKISNLYYKKSNYLKNVAREDYEEIKSNFHLTEQYRWNAIRNYEECSKIINLNSDEIYSLEKLANLPDIYATNYRNGINFLNKANKYLELVRTGLKKYLSLILITTVGFKIHSFLKNDPKNSA